MDQYVGMVSIVAVEGLLMGRPPVVCFPRAVAVLLGGVELDADGSTSQSQ